MIEPLVEYGSALYWVLLFFGIYFVTVFAETRLNTLRPNLWAGLLALFVFGFTTYEPHPDLFALGLVAYFSIGAVFAVSKWMVLVVKVRQFTAALETIDMDEWTMRHLAYEEFCPNNVEDGIMTLPPEPFEFRTRLWLWFIYWPSFTFLRFLTHVHKKLGNVVWKQFSRMSKKIYEGNN